MKKAEFLLEVMAEIDNIKANATTGEISKLNIYMFNHSSPTLCIYGQMTGDCTSQRAHELTPKAYSYISGKGYNFRDQDYTIKNNVIRYTALEKYLYMVKRPMHKKIIAYLKGDRDTLKLV